MLLAGTSISRKIGRSEIWKGLGRQRRKRRKQTIEAQIILRTTSYRDAHVGAFNPTIMIIEWGRERRPWSWYTKVTSGDSVSIEIDARKRILHSDSSCSCKRHFHLKGASSFHSKQICF